MNTYLALGANLGDRAATMRAALRLLSQRVGPSVRCSRFYETRPVGFASTNLFLNAVALFSTNLSAEDLLAATQAIERELGRTTKSVGGHYADRPIDIDILLYDDLHLASPTLTLPHPRIGERRFVLDPLCEIGPDVVIDSNGTTAACQLQHLNRLRISALSPAAADIEEAQEALARLVPQLSPTVAPPTAGTLLAMAENNDSLVLLGRDEEGTIAATATLCFCQMPTGRKAWIEDVVVDAACRRRGYARQIIACAINAARQRGAKSVNLTSKPEREAANSLYRAMGFVPRDTNVYRLPL